MTQKQIIDYLLHYFKCKQSNMSTTKTNMNQAEEKFLCEYCSHLLGSIDSFRRHLKTISYSKTREHQCSICSFSIERLDSIRRHLISNHHSKRARDVTKYMLDFLNPPKAKAPIETRPYQADPSIYNSYIYQQSKPKNKCSHGYCMLLIQP